MPPPKHVQLPTNAGRIVHGLMHHKQCYMEIMTGGQYRDYRLVQQVIATDPPRISGLYGLTVGQACSHLSIGVNFT